MQVLRTWGTSRLIPLLCVAVVVLVVMYSVVSQQTYYQPLQQPQRPSVPTSNFEEVVLKITQSPPPSRGTTRVGLGTESTPQVKVVPVVRSEVDLLSKFGISDTEKTCDDRTGYSLVRRFREGKQHYCKAKGGTEGLQTKNNYGMWCYKVAGWGDRTNNPDVLCDAKGLLRIDFAKMNWRKSSEWDSSGKNNQFQPQKGAFAMPCETDLTLASAVGGDFMKALFSNLEPLALNVANNNDNNDIFDSAGCDKVITHPVIMIVRFEAWNLYHELGEWLNTFITLEVSECEC